MRKKIKYIIIVLFALDFLIACCDCDDQPVLYFTHCSISLSHLDHSGAIAKVTTAAVVKEAYGIRVIVEEAENNCALKYRNTSFLFPTAYATSCDCPENYVYEDEIVTISVYTMNAFDASHPAGTELTNYFMVLKDYEYFTMDQYVQERLLETSTRASYFDLFLMELPEGEEAQQFKVRLELSDDRIIEAQTSPVILN